MFTRACLSVAEIGGGGRGVLADFERTLRTILSGGFRFDAQGAQAHLAQFTEEAFARRAAALLAYLKALRP